MMYLKKWDALNTLLGPEKIFKAREEAQENKGRVVFRAEETAPNVYLVVRLEFNFQPLVPNPFEAKPA